MCLISRYRAAGDDEDLARALEIAQGGLRESGEASHNRLTLFAHLGWGLLSRFNRTHQEDDLENAIRYFHEALAADSAYDIDLPSLRYNLAVACAPRTTARVRPRQSATCVR
jgi:hypothetical protein